MARYDFRCTSCNKTVEMTVSATTIRTLTVPECCGKPMRRVFAPPMRVWKDGQKPQ